MSAVVCFVSLIWACVSLALGVVRIGSWVIDRREDHGTKPIREAAFVAQARGEVRNV